jgi:hypothetical protein
MLYKDFVKINFHKLPSNLNAVQKMKELSKLWRETGHAKPAKAKPAKAKPAKAPKLKSVRKVKGGAVDMSNPNPNNNTTPTNTQQMPSKAQLDEYNFLAKLKSSVYGQYPEPYIKPAVMQARGMPWWLAQHPNQYSANPNLVLVYRNVIQFQTSDFFSKYKDRITLWGERKGFGTKIAQVIPGKPFRIVFRSMSTDDNNQYYMDCTGEDEFMDILDDIKDKGLLIPTEFLSQRFQAINRQFSSQMADNNKNVWKVGYKQGQTDLKPLIDKQQEAIESLHQQLAETQGQLEQQREDSQHESSNSFGWGDALGLVGSVFGLGFKPKKQGVKNPKNLMEKIGNKKSVKGGGITMSRIVQKLWVGDIDVTVYEIRNLDDALVQRGLDNGSIPEHNPNTPTQLYFYRFGEIVEKHALQLPYRIYKLPSDNPRQALGCIWFIENEAQFEHLRNYLQNLNPGVLVSERIQISQHPVEEERAEALPPRERVRRPPPRIAPAGYEQPARPAYIGRPINHVDDEIAGIPLLGVPRDDAERLQQPPITPLRPLLPPTTIRPGAPIALAVRDDIPRTPGTGRRRAILARPPET